MASAQNLVQNISARMRALFAFIDFPLPAEPADMRVIMRELPQSAVRTRSVVKP